MSDSLAKNVCLVAVLGVCVAVVISALPEPASITGRTSTVNPTTKGNRMAGVSPREMMARAAPNRIGDTPLLIPGVRQPALSLATDARIGDDDEVIGISINGEDRAYLVKSLSAVDCHVVNDVIQSRAVTVTYCDQQDCVRVLTATGRSEALDVALGGWLNQKMLLTLGDRRHAQDATDLPLEDVALERTNWATWKAAHPASKVFVGQEPAVGRVTPPSKHKLSE